MEDKRTSQQILNEVAKVHSYSSGFNGKLTHYRIKKFFDLAQVGTDHRWERGLEVGAGEGDFSVGIGPYFKSLQILEASDSYFEKLVKRVSHLDHISPIHSLVEDFVPTVKFDVIFLPGVLEHVADPVAVLKKCKAALAPGGIIYGTVPNAKSLHRLLGVKLGYIRTPYELGALDQKVGHLRYYCSELLRQDLVNAGFESIRQGGIMMKPLDNAKMDGFDNFLLEGFYLLGNDFPEVCAELGFVAIVK